MIPDRGNGSPNAADRLEDTPSQQIHSFMIKIWLNGLENDKFPWSGQIIHIETRYRQAFRSLEEISVFIRPYLEGRAT
jgi:hypothetical protein